MRVRRWLPLLLAVGLAAPAAAQGTAAVCPAATSDVARRALESAIRDTLRMEVADAARAAGIAQPEGIVFAELRNRVSGVPRVWSFRSNVADSISRPVFARRARLLACLPGREAFVNVRLDPSGAPPGVPVERMPVLRNPRELARALERVSRMSGPLERARPASVILRMLVTREGEVAYAELAGRSVNADVDRALLDVARELRFQPARIGNVPVDVWVEQPVEVRVAG